MKNKVKILKALADETRLRILLFIGDGEVCACEVVPFAKKSQPTVSQHLKILLHAGVLSQRRKGKNILYRIKDKRVLNVIKMLG
ncbi:MAG: metalloregulator ArsR/SmtB family transcription factor [Candidatus Micrarchaeia archaeon]